MSNQALPFLDLASPDFSTKSDDVLEARNKSWCARTPFGLAVLRHKQAGMLLRDKRLRQGSYAWPGKIGLNGSFAEFWKRSIISLEGDTHKQLRSLASNALTEDSIDKLKPQFIDAAELLAHRLVEKRRCEFITDFSHPFSGMAICSLLNIPKDQYDFVARNASDLGLAMGVDGKRYEKRFDASCDRLMEFAAGLIERAKSGEDRTGYAARLVQNFEASGMDSEQDLIDLIVISIFGGVDTTRSQLGFAVALFIAHPDQWQALKSDVSLAPNAVEEIIRAWPTTTWATREATEDFEFDNVQINSGETLHFLVHASAMDPLVSEKPDFDIKAKRKIHFGFGGGAHHCLGHYVARTDIACALTVLAETVETFKYDGEPVWMPDSGNTSPVSLPVRVS